MIDRRSVLAAAASFFALPVLGIPSKSRAPISNLRLGRSQPFSFEDLIKEMQLRATQPFVRESSLPQPVLESIDYEQHGKIKFKSDYALFREGPGEFPVTFFHLGGLLFAGGLAGPGGRSGACSDPPTACGTRSR